jgi:hypothetical protein
VSDATWRRWFGRVTSVVAFAAIIYQLITTGTANSTALILLGMVGGLPIVASLEGLIRPAAPPPAAPEKAVDAP